MIEYLFNIRPLPFVSYGISFSFSAAGALAAALIIHARKKSIPITHRKIAVKLTKLLLWYGTISLFLFFLRTERIPYLSMRIWLWVWIASYTLMALFTLYREYRKIPLRKEKNNIEAKKKKYFEL